MKRLILILLALPLVVVLVMLVTRMRWKFSRPTSLATAPALTNPAAQTVALPIAAARMGTNQPLLGETILRDYASTNLPPQNDLTLMSRLLENSLLLLKSAANRPLSANEDWAGLLRGENSAHERFLPDQHLALNAQGQLVDRWKSPLFFHAAGGGRYEIRSAGPDRRLWTDDDIHRNADGSFRRGAELNPPSLFGGTNQSIGR